MAALSVQVPYPVFYDRDGAPLDNGNIYIGAANLDPVTNPIQVYYDEALTITAAQPLKTSNGYVYRNGTPAQLYVNAANFSILINDSKNLLVYNFPDGTGVNNANATAIDYDPPFTGAVTSGYTVSNKLSQSVSVKDFGAIGDGATPDATAIQAALNAMGALTTGGEVYVPAGTYACAATLTIPAKVTLRMGGARIVSSATTAIQIVLGNGSVSGNIIGCGHNSVIQHTGAGYGIRMDGAAESSANPLIADIQLIGSSSGLGGMYATAFNALNTRSFKVSGYTNGPALYHYGVNAVTHFAPVLETCRDGVVNTAIVSYQANAIRVYGGQIVNMAQWGWLENMVGAVQPNLDNLADGVIFENNGVNGSAVTGHMFLQTTVKMSVTNCYFEDYAGRIPVSAVLIGDATNSVQSLIMTGNLFSTAGTNVINNVNGQTVIITGNYAGGAVTNFVNQGTLTRAALVRNNRAPAATNVWAGLDSGLDTNIDSGTLTNANTTSDKGYAFNGISGLAQDLTIRTRAGGTYAAKFNSSAGTFIGYMTDAGAFGCQSVEVGGNKVVGARDTGWAAMTGTASKGGFATSTVTTAQLAQVVKALTDALTASGAIGA